MEDLKLAILIDADNISPKYVKVILDAEQFYHPHPAVQLHHRQKCDGFRYDH